MYEWYPYPKTRPAESGDYLILFNLDGESKEVIPEVATFYNRGISLHREVPPSLAAQQRKDLLTPSSGIRSQSRRAVSTLSAPTKRNSGN